MGGPEVLSPPPAYNHAPFTSPQHQMGAMPQSSQHINQQFPTSFNVYSTGSWSRTFVLGQHQKSPLYAITSHSGLSSKPDVVLHSGPSSNSPPLSSVRLESFSSSLAISLPSLNGIGHSPELTVDAHGWPSRTYAFSVEAGNGNRESFEWRHSHGNDVKGLGGRSAGWKLVRLSGVQNGAGHASGTPMHVASDGNEVVAVCAAASMSVTKRFCFSFLGSGQTGQLGERWAVMAVTSALGIMEKERRRSAAASSGGGGASAGGGGGC